MTELLQTIQTMISSETDDLAQIERTLTDGYAHALELEGEKLRLERRLTQITQRIDAATPRRTRASSRRSRRASTASRARSPGCARSSPSCAATPTAFASGVLEDRSRARDGRRGRRRVLRCARPPPRGSLTGHIVFTATDTPFADDVMLVRSDGTRIDLSKSRASDTAPVVSPDGKHVAFFSSVAATEPSTSSRPTAAICAGSRRRSRIRQAWRGRLSGRSWRC